MKPLDPRATEILQRYRDSEALSADAQTRLLSQMQARVANGDLPHSAVDVPPPALPAPGLAASASASTIVKGVAIVALATTATVLVMRAPFAQAPQPPTRREQSQVAPPPQATVQRSEAAPTPALVEAHPLEPSPQPVRAATRSTKRATRSDEAKVVAAGQPTAEADVGGTLEAEMRLLSTAHAALRAGHPEQALVQLAQHRQRFPRGELAESRDVATILALCRAGKIETGRAEAARFLKLRPGSPFAGRVRSACE